MFYYIFLIIGILLIILDVPILIKILQNKETAVDIKRQYKAVGMVFLFGIAFIGCAFLAKTDDTNNNNKQIERLITSTDNSEVKKYIILLINNRPRMKANISAIESIDARIYELYTDDIRAEEYGWTREISLRIKLKKQTNLPGRWQIANGQNLYYYMGGGPNAGVFAQKDVSQYFADMPIDQDEGTFISMPELKGIENIDL